MGQHGPYVVYVERFHAPIIPARGGISQEACAAGAEKGLTSAALRLVLEMLAVFRLFSFESSLKN